MDLKHQADLNFEREWRRYDPVRRRRRALRFLAWTLGLALLVTGGLLVRWMPLTYGSMTGVAVEGPIEQEMIDTHGRTPSTVRVVSLVPGATVTEFFPIWNRGPFPVTITEVEVPNTQGTEEIWIDTPPTIGDMDKTRRFKPTELGPEETLHLFIVYTVPPCPAGQVWEDGGTTGSSSTWESHRVSFTKFGLPSTVEIASEARIVDQERRGLCG